MGIYNSAGEMLTRAYDSEGSIVNVAYNVNGAVVYSASPYPVDYDDYTLTELFTTGTRNCQGIAVHTNVICQFRGGGGVSDLFVMNSLINGGTIASDISITSDHGDSATFGKEFYDPNDEFPLIYVTADTTPAKIYVNRVTRSSATFVKTLIFPQSAGYYGAGAFDWENNICYLLAYKKNNYQTDDSGTNTTVVSKWDLSNLTDNGDGTYTPAFISQYERPFIYVMQGLAFHDGYIWISSGYGGNTSYIYAMNPTTGVIYHTITLSTREVEGLDFVFDSSTQTYYMVIGEQGGYYKKCTFAVASNG